MGSISAVVWQYRQDEPIRAQRIYLEYSLSSLNATDQSITDLIQSFQVAGAKTNSIYQEKTSPTDAGYEEIILDLQKTSGSIDSIKNLILSQKSQLFKVIPQDQYTQLNLELLNYYTSIEKNLDNIAGKNRQIKEIITAAGPTFFPPQVTDEALWETGKEDSITNYYKQNKTQINIALSNLAQVTPSPEFTAYHQTQINYLENFTKTADEIISIFSEKDTEEVPKIEKAYQTNTRAKIQLEPLSQTLHQERLKVFSTKSVLDQLAGTNLVKNSLGRQIWELTRNLPETKTDIITRFIQTILQARQTG